MTARRGHEFEAPREVLSLALDDIKRRLDALDLERQERDREWPQPKGDLIDFLRTPAEREREDRKRSDKARVIKATREASKKRRAIAATRSQDVERLIRLRGLSDRAIAKKLGIDRASVRHIREERTRLTPAQVRAIRDGL